MKPIEAGCLALIIFGKYTGKIVRVIKYIGEHPNFEGCDFWEIDLPEAISGTHYLNVIGQEKDLMRIDGDIEETESNKNEAIV